MSTHKKSVLALVLGLGLLAGGLLVSSGHAEEKTSAAPGAPPKIGKCQIFPANNPWNQDISKCQVHPNSANFVKSIGADKPLHPDFGTVYEGAPNGIPFVVVKGTQKMVPIHFTSYASDSDPGPYPIPDNAPVEGGPTGTGDRHVLVVDEDHCKLYELFSAHKVANGWEAASGAIFDLKSNKLRPLGWTSADAAGLPIFPGLVRYEEVKKGAINHALRFTVENSQRAYILPATHFASSKTSVSLPPMGLRLRLKASYDISKFPKDAQIILTALKKYGMIVADNGGDWYLGGAPDPRWNDADLATLKQVKGSDFEAVFTGPVQTK